MVVGLFCSSQIERNNDVGKISAGACGWCLDRRTLSVISKYIASQNTIVTSYVSEKKRNGDVCADSFSKSNFVRQWDTATLRMAEVDHPPAGTFSLLARI